MLYSNLAELFCSSFPGKEKIVFVDNYFWVL